MLKKLLAKFDSTSPGLIVGVIRKQSLQDFISVGLESLNGNRITPRTNFRLASISKQFTAYAILLLVSKGRFSLDSSLYEILPDFPEYGRKVTIYHLLTHTSGLIDYEDLLKGRIKPIYDCEVLDMVRREADTKFWPGSKFSYSNTAYCVLAGIIEYVSNQSFSAFMDENIFRHLNMRGTVVNHLNSAVIVNRALGHIREENAWIERDQDLTSHTEGDGGIYSSVADLVNWSNEIDRPTLIPNNLWMKAIRKQELSDESQIDTGEGGYGFGFYIDQFQGLEIIRHGGDSIGFRSAIYKCPSKDITVVVLANNDSMYGTDIAKSVFEKALSGERIG
jgi:CubicO group peptidase (beta-lactamase class C family)